MKTERVKVRPPGKVTITLKHKPIALRLVQTAVDVLAGHPPTMPGPRRFGEIRLAVYRLDAFISEVPATGGPKLAHRQYSFEDFLSNAATIFERNQRLLSLRERITHPNSGRELWNTWRWQSSDETDGAFVTFTFDYDDPEKTAAERAKMQVSVPVLGNSTGWRRQVPVQERIDFVTNEIDTETDHIARAELRAVKHTLLREQGERWDQPYRVGAAGTLVAQPNPGRWLLSMDSDRMYNPIRLGKTRATKTASYRGEQVPYPALQVGVGQSGLGELWTVPQQHRVYFQWFAVYVWGSFFATGTIYLATGRSYRDSLPWYPYPYRMTSSGSAGGNEYAMSTHIERSRAYAHALRQDLAAQVFSPWFSLVLADRIEGFWQLFRRTEYRAGELCGILRINHPSGEPEEAWLWNTERVVYNGGNSIIMDSGYLQTSEVKPYIGIKITNIGF